MLQRLEIVRYRGQFESEPLPPPPEDPEEVVEEEPGEPDVVELPASPPADDELAFGSDVEVTAVVGELLVEPSVLPALVPPVLSPPEGRIPGVLVGVVESDVPGSVVEVVTGLVLLVESTVPTPPVVPVPLAAAVLS